MDFLLAFLQPLWPLGCYIITFCLVGGAAHHFGASYTTAFIAAGVLCLPVGWVTTRILSQCTDWLFDKAILGTREKKAKAGPP